MGVNDCNSNEKHATEVCDGTFSSNEYSETVHVRRVGELTGNSPTHPCNTSAASSILISMKNDGCSHPKSPSPHILRDDKPYTNAQNGSPHTLSPPSPPLSPIPKTSSILMSLKNGTSHVLHSSTSSLYSSPSPPPSRSRTPSPPVTPSSTPPPSPPSHSPNSHSSHHSSGLFGTLSPLSSPPSACFVPNCLVCTRGAPISVLKTPTWSQIMRVVFYTLHRGFPDRQFFNLRSDVYVFMADHWPDLCPSKDASHNWKKQIQDMLSHSKNMFESGTGFYKQNGFWRLKKPQMDPWAVAKPAYQQRSHQQRSHHHRVAGKSSSRTHRCSPEDDIPPGKRFRESHDLDFHIPSLSENKSLVSTFRGLKTEMALMREQMQTILTHRDSLSFHSIIAPVFPSQPIDVLYNWDSSSIRIIYVISVTSFDSLRN